MLDIIRKFFAFCGEENRKKFQRSIVLGVLQAVFEALRIPAIALVLRDLFENNVTTTTALGSLAIMVVSIIGTGLIKYQATMLQTEAGYGTCADKRIEIAEHLRYLPMGYFNANSLGQITSVATNTMQNLEGVATRVIMLVSQGLLTTTLIIVMLLFFDWRIALILAIGFGIFLLVNNRLQKGSQALSEQKISADTVLVDQIMEYIQGISEVKAFHLLGKQATSLNKAIADNVAVNTAMELKLIPYMAVQNLVVRLTGTAMTLASLLFWLNGSMSLLNCVLMIICSFLVFASLETAGSYSALLRTVDLSVDKANEILSTPQMDTNGADIVPATHTLAAEHIDFAYGTRKIIDDVSLTIPDKTTTAIVGPSGSGKTTLTSLLSRFWDVDAGKVTLDGRDVREYSMDSLMKNFSFVFQNVYLFHDTIANNIRFGQEDLPLEKVKEAARKACCDDFIEALPDGYDTVIGEGGASLSGGEKQRISIARAMLKDAPIVILDEATANVDPENEDRLQKAIEALTRDKTIIMIAHRLKTVRHADQILVVDHGRIVQQGTHEQLSAQPGIYADFVGGRKQAASWKL